MGGRPDGLFGVWVSAWKLGSVSGKEGEVCEEQSKRLIDVCCLQEVRWRGQGARILGMTGRRYKPWWSGKDGVAGVGVMVKEELWEKVVEVRRVSDIVMTVVVAFEEYVLRLICVHAPQCGGKTVSFDELKSEWDMHSADD